MMSVARGSEEESGLEYFVCLGFGVWFCSQRES